MTTDSPKPPRAKLSLFGPRPGVPTPEDFRAFAEKHVPKGPGEVVVFTTGGGRR